MQAWDRLIRTDWTDSRWHLRRLRGKRADKDLWKKARKANIFWQSRAGARGGGTNAASFSINSSGESLIPQVPSEHGQVKRYSRSPLASCVSRSSDTAPLAV